MSGAPPGIAQLSPRQQELLLRRLIAKRQAAGHQDQAIRPSSAAAGRSPLSFAQQRLWLLDRLQPGSSAYNIYEGLRLDGPLDAGALAAALGEVVRRHVVLRAVFEQEDAGPVQVIAPHRGLALPIVDLSRLPPAVMAAECGGLAAAQAGQPFDLARGPLHRFRLLRLGAGHHALLITLHHIVADAASMEIFFGELVALYGSFAAGRPSPLAELSIQYPDYAAWQREWLAGERLERQLAYWRQRLAAAPEALPLPADRPRPASPSHAGARLPFALPPPLVGRLRELAHGEGATLFMALLAAFALLLHRTTGEEDLLVGSPIANRERPEVEPLIGFFVNTLVLRCDLSGAPGFRLLLARVRETALGAFAHADLSFERVVEEVRPGRDAGRTPLLQVLFALLTVAPRSAPTQLASGLTLGQVRIPGWSAKFDLNLTAELAADRLRGAFEYSTDLFDAATVARLAGHLERLAAAAAAHPEAPVAELPWLDAAERHQLVREWNDRAGRDDPPAGGAAAETLAAAFAAQARRTPGAVAAACEGACLTFGELDARANRLARMLRRLGVGPEARVGLHLERGLDMVVAVLAVLKAGGAYLPLDARLPAERLAALVEDARPPVVISRSGLHPEASRLDVRLLCLDDDGLRAALAAESPEEPPATAFPESLAYVLYTSGSTGKPKGVQVEHRQVLAYVRAVAARLGLAAGDSYAMVQPLAVDSSVTVLYPPLLYGGCLHLVAEDRAVDAAALGDYFAEHAIDVLKIAPSHLSALLAAAQERVLPRRLLVIGGEAWRPDLAERLRRLAPGCTVFNHYGPTETTVGVLAFRPPAQARHATVTTPLGRPLATARCHVLDHHGGPLPAGVAGELHVGGACVARGYLGLPELTAERFVPDPFAPQPGERLYRTGDLVRRLADGSVEFLGRLDHQVKIRGFRIEPGEIEHWLARHPGVAETVVLARRDDAGETLLAAYVVAAPGAPAPTAGELRAHLAARLPEAMVPSAYVFLPALPRTAHGKLNRSALPAPERTGELPRQAAALPRDPLELALAQIWEELLGVHPISVHDDFFALGGHSLLAVRLMSRIERRFGRGLPLSQLSQGATVAAFARALRALGGAEAARAPLVEIQPGDGARRPLFLVHPAGGNVLCYLSLARGLGREQPVYGLQDPALYQAGEPGFDVPEMAASYLEALRAAQPRGPYLLGGWSLGGVIAHEMAHQLEQDGDDVDLLLLLDTRCPAAGSRETQREAQDEAQILLWFAAQLGVEITAGDLAAEPAERRFDLVLARAQEGGKLPADLEPHQARRIFDVYAAEMSAVASHRPRPCRAPTLLLRAAAGAEEERARGEDERLGWAGLTGEELATAIVPGSHHTLLEDPAVSALAQQIRTRLAAIPATEWSGDDAE